MGSLCDRPLSPCGKGQIRRFKTRRTIILSFLIQMIKVLNLYAGIGGNRKLWENVEVTAVENDPKIAEIYKYFFPQDKVIIAEAHQYLLKHYQEYDFIWSSPPCPTHSRFNNLKKEQIDAGFKPKYPDMKLYEEIIFLNHFFKGKWVVENVMSYYDPLIKPQISGNHYFWTNFHITPLNKVERGIRTETIEIKERKRGFILPNGLSNKFKEKVLNNCVFPELGQHIFKCAYKVKQITL